MSFKTIHASLDTKLKTITGLPRLQEENIRIKLGSGTSAWCRATLLPAKTVIATVGQQGFNQYNGLYQIDLFYPNNATYVDCFDMADTIIATFIPGLILDNTRITNSYIQPGYTSEANYYVVPVIIEWEQYINRPQL
jgi:hypothetical protein